MNYERLIIAMKNVAKVKRVSYIEGHAGVGKSSLAESLAEAIRQETGKEVQIVTVFGSLLKEGEIGGIPVPYNEDGTMLSKYTVHYKLWDILKAEKEGIQSILFIDELNRCENAVQQELMQIILDRRINDTYLPDDTIIIAAGNPPVDEDNDYQVIEMNDALKNRFFKFTLEPSIEDWMRWAIDSKSHFIHPSIIAYIAEYPNALHNPASKDDVKPTPRGWEMFSDAYTEIMGKNEGIVPNEEQVAMIMDLGNGIVGQAVTSQFTTFVVDKARPFLKPKEIIETDINSEKFKSMLNEFANDSYIRKYIVIQRFIQFLNNNISKLKTGSKKGDDAMEKFTQFYLALQDDMKASLLNFMGRNYSALFNKFIDTRGDVVNDYYDTQDKIVHSGD